MLLVAIMVILTAVVVFGRVAKSEHIGAHPAVAVPVVPVMLNANDADDDHADDHHRTRRRGVVVNYRAHSRQMELLSIHTKG